jgi:hypothetical protein
MKTRCIAVIGAAAVGASLVLLAPCGARARDPSTPEWPCVQRKVEKLTSSQVWDGPPVEDVKDWGKTPEIRALVTKLADRRVPLDQAEAALKAFAEGQSATTRDEQLTLVFAGVFETLHNQRKTVIRGLERYLKAQQTRSEELERQGEAIADLETKAPTDEKAAAELQAARERFDWAQRIFHERQTNIPIACEVPVKIDERIFAIARSIRALMNPS